MGGPVLVTLKTEDLDVSLISLGASEARSGYFLFALSQESFGWEDFVEYFHAGNIFRCVELI